MKILNIKGEELEVSPSQIRSLEIDRKSEQYIVWIDYHKKTYEEVTAGVFTYVMVEWSKFV